MKPSDLCQQLAALGWECADVGHGEIIATRVRGHVHQIELTITTDRDFPLFVESDGESAIGLDALRAIVAFFETD